MNSDCRQRNAYSLLEGWLFYVSDSELFSSCDPSALMRRAVIMAVGMLSSGYEDLHAHGETLLKAIDEIDL
jgi:hypothetical protein